MNSVVITGAGGFIGRQCLSLLAEEDVTVHAVSSRRPDSSEGNVHWHAADLLQYDQTRGFLKSIRPDHLLHLAWCTTPGEYWTSPVNQDWREAGLELIRCFLECGGERAVCAGTCAEYEWGHDELREDRTPLIPASLYGLCKNQLRERAEELASRSGLSFAWGRIFFTYGPHEHPSRLVASVIRSLLQGQRAKTTRGESERDFMYVKDVAAALVALLKSPVEGAVNIASGEGVAVRDLVRLIARRVGREDLLAFGALPEREQDPPRIVAHTARLNSEVGFTPHYNLDAGVQETVAWWRQQLNCETQPGVP